MRRREKRSSFSLMSRELMTNIFQPKTGITRKAKYMKDRTYGVNAANRANKTQAVFVCGRRQ